MGLFKNIFGNSNREEVAVKINWENLTTEEQLDTIVEESKEQVVGVFKHSTRCGISRGVLKQFERKFDLNADQIKMYYLDLLAYREVSNKVEERFQIIHQSPQLLLIKGREVVDHDSHYEIMNLDIKKHL